MSRTHRSKHPTPWTDGYISSTKTGVKACSVGLDIAAERRTDVAGKYARRLCGAMFQHRAAADARLIGVGVFREIPVRVINLQQVMEDIADEGAMLSAAFQLEDYVAR